MIQAKIFVTVVTCIWRIKFFMLMHKQLSKKHNIFLQQHQKMVIQVSSMSCSISKIFKWTEVIMCPSHNLKWHRPTDLVFNKHIVITTCRVWSTFNLFVHDNLKMCTLYSSGCALRSTNKSKFHWASFQQFVHCSWWLYDWTMQIGTFINDDKYK